MTGLRIGEAGALQWSDIDFEKKSLSVSKTLYYKNRTEFEFLLPKTKESLRTIILDDTTIAYLQEWRVRQEATTRRQNHMNLILSYDGHPTSRGSLSRIMQRYAKLSDVHYINVHALRHSHASMLIHMGVNPLDVKDRLGHHDIKTTLETYGHLYPNANYVVAEQLNDFLDINLSTANHDNYSSNQFTVGFAKNISDFEKKDFSKVPVKVPPLHKKS